MDSPLITHQIVCIINSFKEKVFLIQYYYVVLARYKDAYVDETKHFVALLKGDEKVPRSPIRDYVATAKIAEAAKASLVAGKAVPFSYKW